jgi:hypothetical protein
MKCYPLGDYLTRIDNTILALRIGAATEKEAE